MAELADSGSVALSLIIARRQEADNGQYFHYDGRVPAGRSKRHNVTLFPERSHRLFQHRLWLSADATAQPPPVGRHIVTWSSLSY